MFKRKLISVLAIGSMVTMMLAGCSASKKEETVTSTATPAAAAAGDATPAATEAAQREAADLKDIIPKDTVTLTAYSQLANYSGEQLGWFAKVMLDKFNVKINIVNEGDGVFDTRVEGGDLGDFVIFGSDGDQYQRAVKSGLLKDWDDEDLVTEYGPYIKSTMQTALDKNKSISGGKVYGYGFDVGTSAEQHQAFMYHPDLRWDLYKQIGYPQVKTLEDYIPVLEKMVKACPKSDSGQKTYGASLFSAWDGDMVMFVKSTAALYGYEEFGFGLYDVNSQIYEPALQDGGMYLRCLKFYNTLFQKGLLDPDSMTQTYEEMTEAYQDGAAFFNIFNWMGSGLYNTEAHLKENKAMLTVAAEDSKTLVNGTNINGGNRIWSIGSKTKYPELCMAILNWLSTPEGRMTAEYGPKGVTWDYNDQGEPYLTDLGTQCKKNGETKLTGDYSGKFNDGVNQINNTTWAVDAVNPDTKDGETYNYLFWKSTLQKKLTTIEEDWKTKMGAENADEYLEKHNFSLAVGTTYSPTTKSDELQITWNNVSKCIKQYSWQAIYAKTDAEFEKIVKEMQDKAKGYGYDECVEYQQKEAGLRKAAEDTAKATIKK
ncbi:MAG: hypothetical protein Q4G58_07525 [bacterium]|nr:hypothetical protein [bacterium]